MTAETDPQRISTLRLAVYQVSGLSTSISVMGWSAKSSIAVVRVIRPDLSRTSQ